jgi:hypothetical protein
MFHRNSCRCDSHVRCSAKGSPGESGQVKRMLTHKSPSVGDNPDHNLSVTHAKKSLSAAAATAASVPKCVAYILTVCPN